jgi:hypothetical protein
LYLRLIIIFSGAIINQKYCAISKLTNEIIIDIVKTIGIDIRFTRTPFIKKGCKFLCTRRLFLVACHHIVASKELVIITIKQ